QNGRSNPFFHCHNLRAANNLRSRSLAANQPPWDNGSVLYPCVARGVPGRAGDRRAFSNMKRYTTFLGFEITLEVVIAAIATAAIVLHLVLRTLLGSRNALSSLEWQALPLLVALVVGGIPLVGGLVRRAARLEF